MPSPRPFDFGALLNNPAFQFGTTLMSNARQPGAIGAAFGTIGKLTEMRQQADLQKAQIENMAAERAAQQRQLDIAQQQYERQAMLAQQQVEQMRTQNSFQQQIMEAAGRMGLFGPQAPGPAPGEQPQPPAQPPAGSPGAAGGAEGSSLQYNIGAGPAPGSPQPWSPPAPGPALISPFNPDNPADPAGPFSTGKRSGTFGAPGIAGNRRPRLKTSGAISDRVLDNLRQVESGGNNYAINPTTKAMGPYQFLPSTVDMLRRQGIDFNPFDPVQARDAANHYLTQLLRQHGDLPRALAAYGGFKTKDPSGYISKVLAGVMPSAQAAQPQVAAGAPIRAGSIKPPTTTPPIPEAGSRAVDIGQLGMLAGLGGVPGAAQIMDFGKMLQPQAVSPGSYQRDPSTGTLTFVPNPYEERRLGNDAQRIGMENQRLGLDAQRLGLESARVGMENERVDIARGQLGNETRRTDVAVDEKNLKAHAARQADLSGYQDLAASMDRLYTQTDALLKHPGLPANTGLSGVAKIYNLTQSGRDASALLESVKNKLVIDTILKMKALSSTGSTGFGALSEKEGARLETYITNLSRAQGLPAIKKALSDIKQFSLDSKGAFAKRLSSTYGADALGLPASQPGASPAQPGGAISLDEYLNRHRK